MNKKIKTILWYFILELKYRILYIVIFFIINIVIILLFWNEIIVIIFKPIQKMIINNNHQIIYEILSKHYIIENNNKILNNDTYYNNEIPYFEINITQIANIDTIFIYIVAILFVMITIPLILYQVTLFYIPMIYKSEYYILLKSIFFKIIIGYLILLSIINYIIPLILRLNTISTEEIGYYEFEVEFDIMAYVNIIINTVLYYTIWFYIIINKKKTYVFIIPLYIFTLYTMHTTIQIIIFVVYTLLIYILYIIKKKCFFYTSTLKYRYAIRFSRYWKR